MTLDPCMGPRGRSSRKLGLQLPTKPVFWATFPKGHTGQPSTGQGPYFTQNKVTEVRISCKSHNMTPGRNFTVSPSASQPQAPHQPQEGRCPGFSKMAQFQIFHPAVPRVTHIRPLLDILLQISLTYDDAHKSNKPRTGWL